MPTTPVYQLPYPAAADPADVPLDMQELAERLELVFPGKELAYAQITADVTVTATTEAGAQAIVTAPAVTFDGATPVIVEFFAGMVQPSAALFANAYLYDGASSLGVMGQCFQASVPFHLVRRLTPSAAAHTYSIRGAVTGGAGTYIARAGAGGSGVNPPAWIRIRRV